MERSDSARMQVVSADSKTVMEMVMEVELGKGLPTPISRRKRERLKLWSGL